jgi:splicing factor U2AF subunit
MARYLARIHGTEEDKVNCPFYFKIGACRHADRCSRMHHRPAFSQTILIKHAYRHPTREAELKAALEGKSTDAISINEAEAAENFLCFFEDFFEELSKFGVLEALHVCDNLGDHMVGHVYAKFSDEEEAADALNVMNGRYYDGRRLEVEFSPVTDFREASELMHFMHWYILISMLFWIFLMLELFDTSPTSMLTLLHPRH